MPVSFNKALPQRNAGYNQLLGESVG
jgi:hypothetical protein